MEKRVIICKKTIYKSKLLDGILAFLILILGDFKTSLLVKSEDIIKETVKVLKDLEESKYTILAYEAEKEIEKLYPNYDFLKIRKTIINYMLLEKVFGYYNPRHVNDILSVSNEKTLKYFDEQLYIKVLECIYSLLIDSAKKLDFNTYSKKIKIGQKTCAILYPNHEFKVAIKLLISDISNYICYNRLETFCSLECSEDSVYLKVSV